MLFRSDLAFDPENPRSVNVTLQIDPTLPIHVDSVASLESQGLTGGVYVEIAGGTAASPLLTTEQGQDYPVIPSRQSTLQQLAQTGPELLGRFNTVGERMGDLLNDENRRVLAETLVALRNTASLIDSHSEEIAATIANMKNATGAITTTLGNVNHTLATTDHALTSVDTTLNTLNGAIDSAGSTVQKLGKLSDDADKVVNGQGIAQMTQLVAQTRALIASLTRLSNDLEREPTRFILGDQRQGYTPK